jgi:hypothetical protein
MEAATAQIAFFGPPRPRDLITSINYIPDSYSRLFDCKVPIHIDYQELGSILIFGERHTPQKLRRLCLGKAQALQTEGIVVAEYFVLAA